MEGRQQSGWRRRGSRKATNTDSTLGNPTTKKRSSKPLPPTFNNDDIYTNSLISSSSLSIQESQQQQHERKQSNSSTWHPLFRSIHVPRKATTTPTYTMGNTKTKIPDKIHRERNIMLAATEIERILWDDVRSNNIDQIRCNEDDEDEDEDDVDENDFNFDDQEQRTLDGQHDQRRRIETEVVSAASTSTTTTTTIGSLPLSSAIRRRFSRRITTPTIVPRLSGGNTTDRLGRLRRTQQETVEGGNDDDGDGSVEEEELLEHHINTYNLFDSAGIDEARMRLAQRRQRRRHHQQISSSATMTSTTATTTTTTSKNVKNSRNSDTSFLSGFHSATMFSFSSSSSSAAKSNRNHPHNHSSSIIYTDKSYDLFPVKPLLTVVTGLFGSLVIIEVISQMVFISFTMGGWILLTAFATGSLLQLGRSTRKLWKIVWQRLEVYTVRYLWLRSYMRMNGDRTQIATTTTAIDNDNDNHVSDSTTINNNSQLNQFCSICLEPYCENEDERSSLFQRQYLVVCNHSFHYNCLQHWLEINKSCPICRIPATFDSTHQREQNQ